MLPKGVIKPFLKWAGGKTQLIPAIAKALPAGLEKINNLTYIEPFVGSGAVLFWMLKTYPNIQHAIINDINTDLYNAYKVVKETPQALITVLGDMQKAYYPLNETDRKAYFLQKKAQFNLRTLNAIDQTALLIFLNHTCFNGLYRVNSNNQFNVPFGSYTRPKICDAGTILAANELLQKVSLFNGDYSETLNYVNGEAFFYFDPPYKPISKTALFNAYSNGVFNDEEQRRLKSFCDNLSACNIPWLLSNSDPKNIAPDNDFFDTLYSGKSIYIDRVPAKRSINSNPVKRGEIQELLISNYKKPGTIK